MKKTKKTSIISKRFRAVVSAFAAFTVAAAMLPMTAAADTLSFGDVDGDGAVDSSDALLVMRTSVGLETLTDDQFDRGDVNSDGLIDTTDALFILQMATGMQAVRREEAGTSAQLSATVITSSEMTEEEKLAAQTAAFEKKVSELCGAVREQNGLSAVEYDPELAEIADIRTEDMLLHDNSHYRPNGRIFSTLAVEKGYICLSIRENIAEGYATPEEVFDAWMNSDGHRKNILTEGINKVGASCRIITKENGAREIYWNLTLARVPVEIGSEEYIKAELLHKINAERNNRGLDPLAYDYDVAQIAKTRANESTVKFDAWTRPDGSAWDNAVYDAMPDFYGLCGNGIIKGKKNETVEAVYNSFITEMGCEPSFFSADKDYTTIGIAHVFKDGDCDAQYWAFVVLTDNM